MRKNVFGVKNITSLIYGLVMLLPFFAILGRVIYTQSNPNAKDSYSSRYINDYSAIYLQDNDEINPSMTYFINTYNVDIAQSTTYNLYITDLQLTNIGSLSSSNINTFQNNMGSIQRIQPNYNGSQISWDFYGRNSDNSFLWLFNLKSQENIQWTMSFKLNNVQNFPLSNIYYVNYVYDITLDNAFEYSLKSFTDDNNLGNVDMFSWFTDMFLDQTKAKNQVYIGFVNWYLNYAMLVSSGYLFFLVLIWFVNFVRRILDKSMYQEYGGF